MTMARDTEPDEATARPSVALARRLDPVTRIIGDARDDLAVISRAEHEGDGELADRAAARAIARADTALAMTLQAIGWYIADEAP